LFRRKAAADGNAILAIFVQSKLTFSASAYPAYGTAKIAGRTDPAPFCLELSSACHAILCIVCLDTRVVLNPLIVLDQLGGNAIRQISRNMIKDT
jgi:hypothetical protein